jgi:uncharacterized cupredoxin-like copper-binding protein
MDETPPRRVKVTLLDNDVRMPATLFSGIIEFEVRNAGTVAHSFAIAGHGIDAQFASPLAPGETNAMRLNLDAGNYTVYCPLDNHAEQGMRLELTVTE